MAAVLKGLRYADAENLPLQLFIRHELPYLSFEEVKHFYKALKRAGHLSRPKDKALLGCNDRFHLLTQLCNREDALHPWLFERCREVENDPDGYLDPMEPI